MSQLRRDDGFTLVELLVAIVIFAILGALLMTTVVAARRATTASEQTHTLNEEARGALNRMTRELRQASAITAVSNPDGATSLSFEVDFNGNGTIDGSASDPERLTYRWDGQRILLTATDASGTNVTQPILAGQVSDFRLEYRSSRYRYDCNGDGVTTWQEIDTPGTCVPAGMPAGNRNGVLDVGELDFIDSVVISFTVLEGERRQDYRTQVDLRNAS